ncbi:MAG: hypothetical protein U9R58_08790, partial [Chloroflexota bacterium]|nr:hypothetical protein [Chloroflexota bacterium]
MENQVDGVAQLFYVNKGKSDEDLLYKRLGGQGAGPHLRPPAQRLDPHQLEKAAYAWIDRSPFFPRISELRDTAAAIKSPQQDLMYIEAQSLKREFFISGKSDLEKWKNLIQRLTR